MTKTLLKGRCKKDVVRKTILRWIFVDVLISFPFFIQFSTVVKVAEDLISFTDLLVTFL